MLKFPNSGLLFSLQKHPLVSLWTFWILGLISGSICSAAQYAALTPLIFAAVTDTPPLFQLLLTAVFPVVLSFLAVFFSEYWLLQPIAFGKGFLFAFVATAVSASYSNAGWLVRMLLMFTDCCTLPPLVWYWIRLCRGSPKLLTQTVILLISFLLISALDFRFISPFLATVTS